MGNLEMNIIAHIETDFDEKFGIPRQPGLVEGLLGRIVFEPEYRNKDCLRGMEGFDRLWLIWVFHQNPKGKWSPMVRPPRLGGNVKMGVFATRSPFRPNPIGLSNVKIENIIYDTEQGPQIIVSGPDMVNGTPILDIKPYVASYDAHPEAKHGFTKQRKRMLEEVIFTDGVLELIPKEKIDALKGVLLQDPRPAYQDDDREYGIAFAGMNIRFRVEGSTAVVVSADRPGA